MSGAPESLIKWTKHPGQDRLRRVFMARIKRILFPQCEPEYDVDQTTNCDLHFIMIYLVIFLFINLTDFVHLEKHIFLEFR